jgi:hypothetical protein
MNKVIYKRNILVSMVASVYEPIKSHKLDGNKKHVVLVTYTGYTTLYPAVVLGVSADNGRQEEGNFIAPGIFVINQDPRYQSWDAWSLRPLLVISIDIQGCRRVSSDIGIDTAALAFKFSSSRYFQFSVCFIKLNIRNKKSSFFNTRIVHTFSYQI